MAEPNIRILEADEYDLWDEFAADSPQGTLFHRSYWLKASGRKFGIYGCFKGDEIYAGFPIVYSVSRVGLKTVSHPYLTPYLGTIFRKSDAKYVTRISDEKEMSRIIASKLKDDFDSIYIQFTPFSIDLQPFIWEGFLSGVRYTYLLDLGNLEDIWREMDAKRRNDITRAEKDGIYVERNGDFEEAFALVKRTYDRQEQETIFKPAAFRYNEVLSQRGQCNSFLARNKEGKAIAAVYIVWDEKRSYYLLGGYDDEESHHGASATAMWEAIKFTKEELGLGQFDFEGSMFPPIEQFFRKFGGKLTPYYFVRRMKTTMKFNLFARRLVKAGLRRLKLR